MKMKQKPQMDKPISHQWRLALILSLTLGLAPFFPEPHVWGKIRWVASGATGMQPMDYFDLLLHGFPWLYLLIAGILTLRSNWRAND